MVTIAIVNQKSGVGKTTITFNLAHLFSGSKRTTVLRIAARAFGFRPANGGRKAVAAIYKFEVDLIRGEMEYIPNIRTYGS